MPDDKKRLGYVNRWQVAGSPQPFSIYGTYMWGFVFHANLTNLERLVDQHLNLDPTGRVAYAPLAPFVMLGFSALDFIQPATKPFGDLGGSYEYELAVWVPVRRRGGFAPLLFTPYVFVNNPLAVVQGREIYGFPKEMAWLRKKSWPDRFPVEAFVVERRGSRAVRRWRRVLSVERVAAGERERRDWQTFDQAVSDLRRQTLADDSWLNTAAAYLPDVRDFWPPNARAVFRKQFPECGEPRRPCYQAIVETNLRVTNVDYGYLLGDQFELRLPSRSSHRIGADLGLRDGDPARLAYEMKFSFDLEAGEEVWRASDGQDSPPPWSLLLDLAAAAPRAIVDLGFRVAQTLTVEPPPPVKERVRKPGRRRRGKEKIAILGGGVGAMSAAFALTQVPDWRKRYDITVYQLGWRLGGKGASGRDRDRHDRIEEHGIHIWFGFYENAFRIMRRCYEGLKDLDAAKLESPIFWGFAPFDLVVLEGRTAAGDWTPTKVALPSRPGWPGDESDLSSDPWQPVHLVQNLLRMMVAFTLDESFDSTLSAAGGTAPLRPEEWAAAGLAGEVARTHPANFLLEAANLASREGTAWGDFFSRDYGLLQGMLWRFIDWIHDVLLPTAPGESTRRLRTAMDLAATVVRGILADGVIVGGFKSLDAQDFAAWLTRHGARPETVGSEWVRAIYSQGFAFEDGDVTKGRAAAGTVLRDTGRMLFTHRGAFVFKMRSGMGDIVFAPLYRYLDDEGVKFRFFHRVRKLHVSPDGGSISAISMAKQATPKPDYPYLMKVKDLWCWPNRPDYDQLEEGEEIRALEKKGEHVNFESAWSAWGPHETELPPLRAGVDFDRVILGIPVGGLHDLCEELGAARPRWARMLRELKTVRTQAFQLWMNQPIAATGWPLLSRHAGQVPPVQGPVLTAFVEPVDTWGDMTHVLHTENWPADAEPRNTPQQIAYFCGVMKDSASEPKPYTDPSFPGTQNDQVRGDMHAFLLEHARHLWPALAGSNSFAWNALVDTQDRTGIDRALDQFCLANIDPSERYVLSLPGTIDARIRADRSGFDNLCLAGDWTYNGINGGCVEAAVMSGLRAARAICDWPEIIVGEDHLEADDPGGDAAPELESEAEAPARAAAGGRR